MSSVCYVLCMSMKLTRQRVQLLAKSPTINWCSTTSATQSDKIISSTLLHSSCFPSRLTLTLPNNTSSNTPSSVYTHSHTFKTLIFTQPCDSFLLSFPSPLQLLLWLLVIFVRLFVSPFLRDLPIHLCIQRSNIHPRKPLTNIPP